MLSTTKLFHETTFKSELAAHVFERGQERYSSRDRLCRIPVLRGLILRSEVTIRPLARRALSAGNGYDGIDEYRDRSLKFTLRL